MKGEYESKGSAQHFDNFDFYCIFEKFNPKSPQMIFNPDSHTLNHISKGSHSAPVWLYNLCSCGWMLLYAEPLEGSANSELCRGMASVATSGLASFLQLTLPIMPPQPASVFTTWVEEATGERRKVSEKEHNTLRKYSGALSLDGSFNSLSVVSLFCDCCYLLTEVSTLSLNAKHYMWKSLY